MIHHVDFEFVKEYIGETVKYSIIGIINLINASVLQYELEDVLKEDEKIIILNMSRVEFICSVGAKIIFEASKQAIRNNKKIIVERPSVIVKNVMGAAMLDNLSR
jgi:anti-anti-sigma factor